MDKRKIPESVIKYSDYLKNLYPNLKQVYVFGSCAKENMKPDSDIDMAFIFQDISDTFDIQIRLMKLRRQFDTRIEPHVFDEEDFGGFHPLACEILKTGYAVF
ncbi:Nucleotidyltransferase domain-containing protein [Desulfonema limicola]|uniref:Nucleotidyltransferase domain-containing protein n=1 Tax=Desulfonema limicola TaxID=45656 RepID=A0A975BDC0_9BACT|nr:nucleotidyltransferase domain-containing protein [Desulfonema limicola]QTA83243.1 Nucleotidyltransferase domain-containing protein [Desulfonema limicola]